MAQNITLELYKVVTLMGKAGRQVATYFRQANDADALEMYGDLLDVNRDFLGMVGVLRNEFALDAADFEASLEGLSSLFSEMIEIQENEDWILLADLLECSICPCGKDQGHNCPVERGCEGQHQEGQACLKCRNTLSSSVN